MQFARGDKIRLTQDCAQIHLPDPLTPKEGETGRVARLYRVQDGLEIYEVILDRGDYTFAAITHTQMEKL